MTANPALQALLFAYQVKAKIPADADALALLTFVAAWCSRPARDGEPANELLFVATVLRKAALDLPRFEARQAALVRCMP